VSAVRWIDSWATDPRDESRGPKEIDWVRILPFVGMHVACLGVVWVGFSWTALAVAVAFYAVRMFAITAFYHRYFSHRAFKTSRLLQFLFALLGATAVQRGPLWWASHHRAHHKHSDRDGDTHSPELDGFWWSHVGWIVAHENFKTREDLVPDLMRFPELRFLDRFNTLVPLSLIPLFFGLGWLLEVAAPGLGTSGLQMLVWGFFLSTVALYHLTFTINSLAHRFGSRRYETRDNSRNSLLLSLITFGEGWHNNHHYYSSSARQGFRWFELDLSYYGLRIMAALGLIWSLRPVPARVIAKGRAL
jgi:stearoyl-CoA desaturase (delta-9 desaturase)